MEKSKVYTINKFTGLNVETNESLINDSESPEMCNFEIGSKGNLSKRLGYENYNKVGAGPIRNVYYHTFFAKDIKSIMTLIFSGNTLYRLVNGVATTIFVGLTEKCNFFSMNNNCYVIGGGHYLYFEGDEFKGEVIPYIPEMFRNGKPIEDYNLLGESFKCVFSPDGTEKVFYLGVTDCGPSIKVSYDGGVTWDTSNTGFVFDRVAGKVTFNTAPVDGDGTLHIQAKKSSSWNNCVPQWSTISVLFGGNNDTRILISGNHKMPNRIWRSGLYDPTYFPENGYSDLGQTGEPVMGFAKQYDSLVVIKKTCLFLMHYDVDKSMYTSRPINNSYGCCSKKTVLTIDNYPIWLDQYKGVCILKQSNVREEKNVEVVSLKINDLLLKESNIQNAIALDYDRKYHIFINNKVYIYDYTGIFWYMFDNIPATCVYDNENLEFGDNNGNLVRFKKVTDEWPYSDNGKPIKAYWYSKLLDFGLSYKEKTIRKMFYTLLPADRTSIKMYLISEFDDEKLLVYELMYMQKYEPFYYEPMSYISNSFPLADGIKSKIKKAVAIKIKIQNEELDESMDMLNVSFEVQPGRMCK